MVDEEAMEKVSVLFLGSGEWVDLWGIGTKGLGRWHPTLKIPRL